MWTGQAPAGSLHRGHEDTMTASGGCDGRMPTRRLGAGLLWDESCNDDGGDDDDGDDDEQ